VPTLLYYGDMDDIGSPEITAGLLAAALRQHGVPYAWLRPANGRHVAGSGNYGSGSVVYQMWEYSVLEMIAFLEA